MERYCAFLEAIYLCNRIAHARGSCIVFETYNARLSRLSKVAPPAEATAREIALKRKGQRCQMSTVYYSE